MPQGNQTFRNTRTEMIEEKEVCPYNRSHLIRPERMARHLLLCRKDVLSKPTHPFHHEARQMEICPLDANHHICKAEMPRHIKSCTARQQLVVANIDDGPEPEWRSCIPKGRSVETKEDDWGEEADRNPHETYNPELKIQNSSEPILYNIQGRSKSEKKNYRSEQRLKYGTNQSASWNEEDENLPVGLPTNNNTKKKNKKKQASADGWANTSGWTEENPKNDVWANTTEWTEEKPRNDVWANTSAWTEEKPKNDVWANTNGWTEDWKPKHTNGHNERRGQHGNQDSSVNERNYDSKQASVNQKNVWTPTHATEYNGGCGQHGNQDSSRNKRNCDSKHASRSQKNDSPDANAMGANRPSNEQNHGSHLGWNEDRGATVSNVWYEAGSNNLKKTEEPDWQNGYNEDWERPTFGQPGSRTPDTHGSRYSDGPWSSSRASSSSPDQTNIQSLSPLGNRRNIQLSPSLGRGRGRGRGNHMTSPLEVGNLKVTLTNDGREQQDWDNDLPTLVPKQINNQAQVEGQFCESIRSMEKEPEGNMQHSIGALILDEAFVDNNSEDIFQSDEEDEYFPAQDEKFISPAIISPNELKEDSSCIHSDLQGLKKGAGTPPDQVPQDIGRGVSRPPPGFHLPSPEAPMLSSPGSEHQQTLAAQFQHPMMAPQHMIPLISPHQIQRIPGVSPSQIPMIPGVSPPQMAMIPGVSPQQIAMLPGFSPHQTQMLQGVFPHQSIWAQNWMAQQAMAQQVGQGNVLGVDGLGHRLETVKISGQETRDAPLPGNSTPWDHQEKNSLWPHQQFGHNQQFGRDEQPWPDQNSLSNLYDQNPWSDQHSEPDRQHWPDQQSVPDKTPWPNQQSRHDNNSWSDQQSESDHQSSSDRQSLLDQEPWRDQQSSPDKNPWSDQQSRPDRNHWPDQQSGPDQQFDQKHRQNQQPLSDQQSRRVKNPWPDHQSGSDKNPWPDHQSDMNPWFSDQSGFKHQSGLLKQSDGQNLKKEEKCVFKPIWGNGEAKSEEKLKWHNLEEIKDFTPGGIPREDLPLDAIPFDSSDFPALG